MSEIQYPLRTRAEEFFRKMQDEITAALEILDGGEKFFQETWERPGGGGGRTRIMQEGAIFEKAGVNFSAVHGESPESILNSEQKLTFFATGISLVLHPRSPKIPTVHANFRYFEQSNGQAWFGGGMDLTPYYLDEEDAVHFHRTLKTSCDKHDPFHYPRFKKWCDEYFFIKHRAETRGIGGIFFDNLSANDVREQGNVFAFVQDAAHSFLPAYIPIVEKHKDEHFTESEKHWQLLRRGRYVEFNLVYDRGTRFGLETNGRTESILMSLPTVARWEYDVHPAIGSPEVRLVEVLQHPREWAV
jgi:coproporphyrinogen III oxidase